MDVLVLAGGFILLMILQHMCYKQDVESAYREGYNKGLYTAVVKASCEED